MLNTFTPNFAFSWEIYENIEKLILNIK